MSSTQQQNGGVGSFVAGIFTREAISTAGTYAKSTASDLHKQAQDGDYTLRFLALIGGIMMIVFGSMELVAKFVTLNIIGAIFETYSIVTGIIIIILEGKSFLMPASLQARVYKYAMFLKYLWGRGLLYFISGSLQLYQLSLWNFISGGYMCAIGVLFILVGWRTASKLKSLRKELFSPEQLQQMFAQADLDGDGGLSLPQFRTLTESMGMDMTRREVEAAFGHIKKSDNEKLSYEEFYTWWSHGDRDEEFDERAFSSFV